MKILGKINYVQLLFHFLATWFLIISFQKFDGLLNIKLIEIISSHGAKDTFVNHDKYGLTLEDVSYFSVWLQLACLAAIGLGLILSIVVSKTKNLPLINSLIVFVACYLCFRLNVFNFRYSSLFSLNGLLNNYQLDFIFMGSIFLVISMFFFFSKRINKIIQKQHLKQQ